MGEKLSKKQKLHAVYAQIPKLPCTGKCKVHCTLIPMTKIETRIIRKVRRDAEFMNLPMPGHYAMVANEGVDGPVCKMLVAGQCSIYDDRPFVCRLYGVTEDLPCTHGCTPERVLTRKEVLGLMEQIKAI